MANFSNCILKNERLLNFIKLLNMVNILIFIDPSKIRSLVYWNSYYLRDKTENVHNFMFVVSPRSIQLS